MNTQRKHTKTLNIERLTHIPGICHCRVAGTKKKTNSLDFKNYYESQKQPRFIHFNGIELFKNMKLNLVYVLENKMAIKRICHNHLRHAGNGENF